MSGSLSTYEFLERQRDQATCGEYGHVFDGESSDCVCGRVNRETIHREGARRWNGGVFLDRLIREAPDTATVYPCTDPESILIRGLKPLDEAGPDDMTWLSLSRAKLGRMIMDPVGVIVVPTGFVGYRAARCVIECDDPKSVFAEIANRLFVDSAPTFGHQIHPTAVIGPNVTLGRSVVIGPHTAIANATIGDHVTIGANCAIGLPGFGFTAKGERFPHVGKVVIGNHVQIASNVCIDRGSLGDTVLKPYAKIDNLCHIAHNCVVGEHAFIIASTVLCGGVVIGEGAWVAPNSAIREQLTIGEHAVVGLGATVVRSVDAGTTVVGNPAKVLA